MNYKAFGKEGEISRKIYDGPFFIKFNSAYSLEQMVVDGVYLPFNKFDTNTNFIIRNGNYYDPWIEFYTNFNKDTELSHDSINVLYRKFRPPNYPNIYKLPFYGFWRDDVSELNRIGFGNIRETLYLAVFKCRIKYKYMKNAPYPLINVYCKEYLMRKSHGPYDTSVLEFEMGICDYVYPPFYQVLSIDSIEPVHPPPYAPYRKETDTIYSFR